MDGFCEPHGPILVDVAGDGFSLTGAARGVDFALTAAGARVRVAWTASGSDDAWLALDRDGDGTIGGAQELFGNFTPQPPSAEKHGLLAPAFFDEQANAGNSDGRIDAPYRTRMPPPRPASSSAFYPPGRARTVNGVSSGARMRVLLCA